MLTGLLVNCAIEGFEHFYTDALFIGESPLRLFTVMVIEFIQQSAFRIRSRAVEMFFKYGEEVRFSHSIPLTPKSKKEGDTRGRWVIFFWMDPEKGKSIEENGHDQYGEGGEAVY